VNWRENNKILSSTDQGERLHQPTQSGQRGTYQINDQFLIIVLNKKPWQMNRHVGDPACVIISEPVLIWAK